MKFKNRSGNIFNLDPNNEWTKKRIEAKEIFPANPEDIDSAPKQFKVILQEKENQIEDLQRQLAEANLQMAKALSGVVQAQVQPTAPKTEPTFEIKARPKEDIDEEFDSLKSEAKRLKIRGYALMSKETLSEKIAEKISEEEK